MKFATLPEAIKYRNDQQVSNGSNFVYWIEETKDGVFVWCNLFD